jgi:hypothetical protein
MGQALIQFGGLNMFRIEHDIATGEVKEIVLNATEIKAIEKLHTDKIKNLETVESETKAKEAARQAILDRLGLTADEAKLLLG